MFHAMAWGLPYAAFMSGASLIMPDRFLQAAPIAAMIAAERPTLAGAVPTIWNDLLAYLDANPTDTSSLKEVDRRRLGLPAGADARLRRAARHRDHPRLGHDRDVAAGLGVPRRRPALTGDEAWAYRYTQGRVPAGVEARIVGPTGDVMPADGEAVGELEVRGPWVTAQLRRRRRARPGEVPRRLAAHRRRRHAVAPTAS